MPLGVVLMFVKNPCLLFLFCCAFLACDDSDSPSNEPIVIGDEPQVTLDSGMSDEDSAVVDAMVMPQECRVLEPEGTRLIETAGDVKILLARDNRPTGLYDMLQIEVHPERGAAWAPGTFDLSQVGTDYETCSVCVIGTAGIRPGMGTSEAFLMATSGTVEIVSAGTATGESVEIRLGADVKLYEHSITQERNRFVTEKIENGREWCVENLSVQTNLGRREPPRDSTNRCLILSF